MLRKLLLAALPACVAAILAATSLGAEPVRPTAVLSITVEGGFVPFDVAFGTVPVLVAYRGGRAVMPATRATYPGTAVQRLRTVKLTPAELKQLLDRARADGLVGGTVTYPVPPVTDLPTTTVTIVADGRTYSHAAYALGFEQDGETGARKTLQQFVAFSTAFVKARGRVLHARRLPERVRMLATPQTSSSGTVRSWPLANVRLADAPNCRVIAAPRAIRTLGTLRQGVLYRDRGVVYQVGLRSLLPGDSGCSSG